MKGSELISCAYRVARDYADRVRDVGRVKQKARPEFALLRRCEPLYLLIYMTCRARYSDRQN